jgi:hypothetical protein
VRLASWRFACCSIWDERPNAPEHSALLSLGRVGVKRERSAERRAESRGREADSDRGMRADRDSDSDSESKSPVAPLFPYPCPCRGYRSAISR